MPFAGCLRASDATRESSIALWLDGNTIALDSARYTSIVLCVDRGRSPDPNDDARPDEDSSDEELILTETNLEEAMNTIFGGRVIDNHE